MSTLKIIAHTGGFASDQIFVGMYGNSNQEGKFAFDSSLMGLDVAKLTQISIEKGRQSFPEEQLHTVEADDDTIRVLKCVLLWACQSRWNSRYDQLIALHSQGMASTLEAAKEMDAMTADAALEDLGFKAADRALGMKLMRIAYDYRNALIQEGAQSEEGYSRSRVAVANSISTLRAFDQITSIEPSDEESLTSGISSADAPASANFFSGSAVTCVRLPAAIANDQTLMIRVANALLKMPTDLLMRGLNVVTDTRLLSDPLHSVAPVLRERIDATPVERALPSSQNVSEGGAQQAAEAFLQGAVGGVDAPDEESSNPNAPGVA